MRGLQANRYQRIRGFSTTMRYINRHYLSIYQGTCSGKRQGCLGLPPPRPQGQFFYQKFEIFAILSYLRLHFYTYNVEICLKRMDQGIPQRHKIRQNCFRDCTAWPHGRYCIASDVMHCTFDYYIAARELSVSLDSEHLTHECHQLTCTLA